MGSYEKLMEKSEVAEMNALRCETEWSRNYWRGVSLKLKERAENEKLCEVKK